MEIYSKKNIYNNNNKIMRKVKFNYLKGCEMINEKFESFIFFSIKR